MEQKREQCKLGAVRKCGRELDSVSFGSRIAEKVLQYDDVNRSLQYAANCRQTDEIWIDSQKPWTRTTWRLYLQLVERQQSAAALLLGL